MLFLFIAAPAAQAPWDLLPWSVSCGLEDPFIHHRHGSAALQEEIWGDCPHFQLGSDAAMARGLLRL